MSRLRRCRDEEREALLEIINSAAQVYREAIPADCWHEPYMPGEELDTDIRAGVEFWGYELDGRLAGVMGLQRLRDFDLIRHAYVLPSAQRHGIGAALLEHLRALSGRRMLVGTWAAASWAIRFYERHGFRLIEPELMRRLMRAHWDIPERQVETSVVLASPTLEAAPPPDR